MKNKMKKKNKQNMIIEREISPECEILTEYDITHSIEISPEIDF